MTLKEVKAALAKVPEGNSGTEVMSKNILDNDEDGWPIKSIVYFHRHCLTNGDPPDVKILIETD